ncbi:uncharacterized protein LOC122543541 [Chiloscyllium plagiosum]|uniref:uncharacterized protein LOC122543541 n=1 Tax=Chiloscyllium plagiosum TaxID=36176 RepID=UPI001CB7FBEB|nr:uncharacterized protein LOC122543541 [Chiloscyllium plagiosum]
MPEVAESAPSLDSFQLLQVNRFPLPSLSPSQDEELPRGGCFTLKLIGPLPCCDVINGAVLGRERKSAAGGRSQDQSGAGKAQQVRQHPRSRRIDVSGRSPSSGSLPANPQQEAANHLFRAQEGIHQFFQPTDAPAGPHQAQPALSAGRASPPPPTCSGTSVFMCHHRGIEGTRAECHYRLDYQPNSGDSSGHLGLNPATADGGIGIQSEIWSSESNDEIIFWGKKTI